jgi:hypothetical protein
MFVEKEKEKKKRERERKKIVAAYTLLINVFITALC